MGDYDRKGSFERKQKNLCVPQGVLAPKSVWRYTASHKVVLTLFV
jgi:hypothetical protein